MSQLQYIMIGNVRVTLKNQTEIPGLAKGWFWPLKSDALWNEAAAAFALRPPLVVAPTIVEAPSGEWPFHQQVFIGGKQNNEMWLETSKL